MVNQPALRRHHRSRIAYAFGLLALLGAMATLLVLVRDPAMSSTRLTAPVPAPEITVLDSDPPTGDGQSVYDEPGWIDTGVPGRPRRWRRPDRSGVRPWCRRPVRRPSGTHRSSSGRTQRHGHPPLPLLVRHLRPRHLAGRHRPRRHPPSDVVTSGHGVFVTVGLGVVGLAPVGGSACEMINNTSSSVDTDVPASGSVPTTVPGGSSDGRYTTR